MLGVPLDGRPRLPADIRLWVGDPRGSWDGDTLVVESTNFLRETLLPNSSRHMHLVERFTRVDVETLRYDVTVKDPTVWTHPWSFSVLLRPRVFLDT